MRRVNTEVLVIGGGATGTGVLRDLAMRGLDAILVEKRDLTHGTTGRYHGLLHSGARYVVKDPGAAAECIEENRVLRRIMPHCIEDTSGFFVVTPWDDPDYIPRFVDGCRTAGIPCEEVDRVKALRREPGLHPDISHVFEVPDAAADSFLAAQSTAASAREHGAEVLPYHEVRSLVRSGDRVVGARCHDLAGDEEVEVTADLVINASGAWAGQIAATANVEFQVLAGKGTMLAVNHRVVNTVVNRCKMPDDGDIIVPIRTVAVIGTTDEGVGDPDRYSIEPWEIQFMLSEGDKLVPGISGMRILRAWAGVRPLFHEGGVSAETRNVTRAYALLDHSERDGVDGFLTITGGKWTTFRQMAEVTVDAACRHLGVDRPCRTHLEPVPDRRRRNGHHWLGERLDRVEEEESYGELVCECELATRADVAHAIVAEDARTIDDVRRTVRLGMGPCQGGWCLPRAAGILHHIRRPAVSDTNVALRDFMDERWKGLAPVLWGDQLRQARLDDLVLESLLSIRSLPGPSSSRLGPAPYAQPTDHTVITARSPGPDIPATEVTSPAQDVIVVGGGLAGLVAAWQSAAAGAVTTLLTKGWGSLAWHTGCIDVLSGPDPKRDLTALVETRPAHPYSLVGLEALQEAVASMKEVAAAAGYPLVGSVGANLILPSGLGAGRPTCLAPATMAAGRFGAGGPILIVGLAGFGDFMPELVADNLAQQGVEATAVTVELDELRSRRFVTGTVLAGLFETDEFRSSVVRALSGKRASRIGFPAVLGMDSAGAVVADLSERLGAEVFEIPTLPPSIPGLRLQALLRRAITEAGGRVVDNTEVKAVAAEGESFRVTTTAAARHRSLPARRVVLATGGILGGGIVGEADGSLRETVAGLVVSGPSGRQDWFGDHGAHPLYRAGIQVDRDLSADGFLVAGGLLAGADPLAEGSLEGIALATGWVAGRKAAG